MRVNAIIPKKRAFRITAIGCMLMSLGASSAATAESGFIPWDSEVRVADENYPGAPGRAPKKSLVYNGPQGGAWLLIRFFQVVISPQDGSNCGYTPVCSAYGRLSVERHGAALGMFLAFDRVLRCNPFNAPGADPVPQRIFGP